AELAARSRSRAPAAPGGSNRESGPGQEKSMLDVRTIRDNPELVKAAGRRKRMDCDGDVDRVIELDLLRRKLTRTVEELKAEKNRVSKVVPKLSGAERDALVRSMKEVSQRLKGLDDELAEIETELRQVMLRLPQIPDPDVPDGLTSDDNVEIRRWGEPPKPDFELRDHLELGKELDIIDIPRATKIS